MSETSMIDQVVSAVVDTIGREYVQVEVSARHVHLSQADLEKLFGPGTTLTPRSEEHTSEENCLSRDSFYLNSV